MSLPKKYQISKKDAILGAITPYGFPKDLINKSMPIYSETFELIEILNGHKPVQIITNLSKLFNNLDDDLYNYIKQHNIYMISIYSKKYNCRQTVIWGYKKYTKYALLLYLHHCSCVIKKSIQNQYHKELNKFIKSLKLSKNIIDFIGNYISGYLLGYRPSSIEGFYLYLEYMLQYKDLPKIKRKLLFNNNSKILQELKKTRKVFKASPQYDLYKKEYPILVKKCNEWIKYILNDSKMFQDYFDKYKINIEIIK